MNTRFLFLFIKSDYAVIIGSQSNIWCDIPVFIDITFLLRLNISPFLILFFSAEYPQEPEQYIEGRECVNCGMLVRDPVGWILLECRIFF